MSKVIVEEEIRRSDIEVEHFKGGYVTITGPDARWAIDLHVEGELTVRWASPSVEGKCDV